MFLHHKIIVLVSGILLLNIPSNAQNSSVSLGNFYVPAKGHIAIFSDHNFQEIGTGLLSGLIATDRSNSRGQIIFSSTSTWKNANDYSHVDGYVKSVKEGAFVFPLGDNGIYGPIALKNAKNVEAAYFAVDPSYAVTSIVLSHEYTTIPEAGPFDIELMSQNLGEVSDKEYWQLNGTALTTLTIPWSGFSDIEELVESDLSQLTIVGWDGTSWIEIPSSLDEYALDVHNSQFITSEKRSNFIFGSITTDIEIIPDEYKVYSLGRLSIDTRINHNRVSIYPNPVKSGGYVNVRYSLAKSKSGTLKIFNSSNQLILEKKLSAQEGKIEIPLDEHGRGVYNMAITNAFGHTLYKKLIVVDL